MKMANPLWVGFFFSYKKDIEKNTLSNTLEVYYKYILFFTIKHYADGKTTKHTQSYI